MELAAREESQLAIESGKVSLDGITHISVVADGSWCKRKIPERNIQIRINRVLNDETGKIILASSVLFGGCWGNAKMYEAHFYSDGKSYEFRKETYKYVQIAY